MLSVSRIEIKAGVGTGINAQFDWGGWFLFRIFDIRTKWQNRAHFHIEGNTIERSRGLDFLVGPRLFSRPKVVPCRAWGR